MALTRPVRATRYRASPMTTASSAPRKGTFIEICIG